MQGTRAIKFENCGRRFSLDNWNGLDTVSGRAQNWLDVDGSASGTGMPTIMVSGAASATNWWNVDNNGMFIRWSGDLFAGAGKSSIIGKI